MNLTEGSKSPSISRTPLQRAVAFWIRQWWNSSSYQTLTEIAVRIHFFGCAPLYIVMFRQVYAIGDQGRRRICTRGVFCEDCNRVGYTQRKTAPSLPQRCPSGSCDAAHRIADANVQFALNPRIDNLWNQSAAKPLTRFQAESDITAVVYPGAAQAVWFFRSMPRAWYRRPHRRPRPSGLNVQIDEASRRETSVVRCYRWGRPASISALTIPAATTAGPVPGLSERFRIDGWHCDRQRLPRPGRRPHGSGGLWAHGSNADSPAPVRSGYRWRQVKVAINAD